MKIRSVSANSRKKAFEVRTASKAWTFPYSRAEPAPRSGDLVAAEGTVHIDQVREYNQDPAYLRDQLLYELTLKAQQLVEGNALSRLLDQTNYRKSVDQLVSLIHVLDCEVEVVIREKNA